MEDAHGMPADEGHVGAVGEAGHDSHRVSRVIEYAGVRARPGAMPQPQQTPQQAPQQEATPQAS